MANDIYFSAGKADITPLDKSINLFNHQKAEGVHDSLEINLLIFKEERGTTALLSIDTLFSSAELESQIHEKLRTQGYQGAFSLIVFASHTHFAPMLDNTKKNFGQTSPLYLEMVKQKIVQKVLALDQQVQLLGKIDHKQSSSSLGVYRRRWGWSQEGFGIKRKKLMLPDPSRVVDGIIHLLEVYDCSGQLSCVLWNFACHPVCFPLENTVSSDYPGIIREKLRQHYQSCELPVLFLQGFSGNIRPWNLEETPPQKKSLKTALWNALNAPIFRPFTLKSWKAWCDKLWEDILPVLDKANDSFSPKTLKLEERSIPLASLIKGSPPDKKVSIYSLTLGDNLKIVGITAEVCNEYTQLIRQLYPKSLTLTAGCVGQVFGYLPTQKMITEGGYEVEGFQTNFEAKGAFSQNAEKTFLQAFTDP